MGLIQDPDRERRAARRALRERERWTVTWNTIVLISVFTAICYLFLDDKISIDLSTIGRSHGAMIRCTQTGLHFRYGYGWNGWKYLADRYDSGHRVGGFLVGAGAEWRKSRFAGNVLISITWWSIELPWWGVLFWIAPRIIRYKQLGQAKIVRRKSILHRICVTCGYDLRATPDGRGPLLPRCPECGTFTIKRPR